MAQLPRAEINGDVVIIHNVRNCDYRTLTDYTPRWETRTVNLSKITGKSSRTPRCADAINAESSAFPRGILPLTRHFASTRSWPNFTNTTPKPANVY